VNLRNSYEQTALYFAVLNNREDYVLCIRQLLNHADIDIWQMNGQGYTVMKVANGNREHLIYALLVHGRV
jgi:ankyrin repeat protein